MDTKPITQTRPVGYLKDDLHFVDDYSEVAYVLSAIGVDPAEHDYRALFIDTADGDYSEVWAITSIVPYNATNADRLL